MTDDNTIYALKNRPLTSDHDLTRLVTALLEQAYVSRVWLMLLDDDLRSTDVIIPIDDLPTDPMAATAMPVDGPVAACDGLGVRVAQIVDQTPASAVVVIWERPGAAGADPDTLAWIDGMRRAFLKQPDGLRAQLVLTDDGAHMIGEPAQRYVA
ncbi:MAG: hypothetical protein ACTH0E_00920 [Candidatus Microbacterium stercoravium]